MPTFRRSPSTSSSRISVPSKYTVPDGGSHSRFSTRSSVDFPLPLGPITPTIAPFGTSTSIPRSIASPDSETLIRFLTRNFGLRSPSSSSSTCRISGSTAAEKNNIRWNVYGKLIGEKQSGRRKLWVPGEESRKGVVAEDIGGGRWEGGRREVDVGLFIERRKWPLPGEGFVGINYILNAAFPKWVECGGLVGIWLLRYYWGRVQMFNCMGVYGGSCDFDNKDNLTNGLLFIYLFIFFVFYKD